MNLTTWVVVTYSVFSALFSNYKTLSALLNIKMYINIVICTWVCCFHLECLSLSWQKFRIAFYAYSIWGVSEYFDIHIFNHLILVHSLAYSQAFGMFQLKVMSEFSLIIKNFLFFRIRLLSKNVKQAPKFLKRVKP